MQINISSWEELRDEVIRLMKENEQLKRELKELKEKE